MKKLSLTVIMLTLNEDYHLSGAIENVQDWAEEIFILDSLSSDRTIDIALEKGVTLVQRHFTNFGDQWNFALKIFPVKTRWVLKMDPDERLTEKLKGEITKVINQNESDNGYAFRRRLWFMGKPLHVYNDVLRLWKTGSCKFSEVLVNEHPIIEGTIGHLNGLMEHYDSRDLHHWLEKQNSYTTYEAVRIIQKLDMAAKPKLLGSSLERRMFVKNLFYKIPLRYQFLWLHRFFLRGAWKSGINGFYWTSSRILVAKMTEFKFREGRITGQVPLVRNMNKSGKRDERVKYYK